MVARGEREVRPVAMFTCFFIIIIIFLVADLCKELLTNLYFLHFCVCKKVKMKENDGN